MTGTSNSVVYVGQVCYYVSKFSIITCQIIKHPTKLNWRPTKLKFFKREPISNHTVKGMQTDYLKKSKVK